MFSFEFYVIGVGDDFGSDEAFLEIGMNDAGCFRRCCSYRYGPGTDFLGACSKIRFQAE